MPEPVRTGSYPNIVFCYDMKNDVKDVNLNHKPTINKIHMNVLFAKYGLSIKYESSMFCVL